MFNEFNDEDNFYFQKIIVKYLFSYFFYEKNFLAIKLNF